MHLNMCIPHLFNKHSLALIIYDNTSEETSKHSAVDSTEVRKPLQRETALWPPALKPPLGQGLEPHLVKDLRGARISTNEEFEVVFDFKKKKTKPKGSMENSEQYYK